jgi:hypothetical protein
MSKEIVKLIESGKLVDAQDALNESLSEKAAEILTEKRKQIVAKTFNKKKQGKEKAIFDASKKKAKKDEKGKLKKVK